MAKGVSKRKCDWQHSMAHPRKSSYKRKNLADISYTDQVLSEILFHGNGCRSENMQFAAFNGPSSKLPRYRRKNVANIFYTSQVIANFVSNFVGMATGVGQGKCNWQHLMAHHRKPPPYRCKNLVKISYASQVIATFVPNFVVMATREGPG